MRFTKKTEEQIQTGKLVEAGTYPFEVIEAADTTSKKGADMISLKLRIWDSNNNERYVLDWLLEAMDHKLKHFCDATGLEHKYDEENLVAEDCIGKSGYLNLVIQKDKKGEHPPQNSVKDYVPASEDQKKLTKVMGAKADDFLNDDIEF